MTAKAQGAELQVLGALADESLDGMAALDGELRFLFWNRAMQSLFGLPADAVLGQSAFDLLPFLVESGEDERYREALAGIVSSSRDRPFSVPGTEREGFYDARYAPLRDASGGVSGVVCIMRDVTERRRTAEQLEETEARFRNMADVSPVLLWLAGRDALCTFFNQTWLDFTGRSLDQEWGVGWAEGVHPEDFQRCMDTYIAAFGERRLFEMEYRLRRADGEYRWVLDRGCPRYSQGGRFAGFIGSCIDITDRKRAEAELVQAVRARDEFLSIASHELRTPLTALQLQLESLMRLVSRIPVEARGGERLERSANTAIAQSERMAMLVEVMLDVSRIAEGRLALEYEELDFAAVAREAAGRLSKSAAEVGSSLHVVADEALTGVWDRLRLEQVATNLLTNAIKYGEGKPITVSARADPDGEGVQLVVQDRGIGISADDQDRIFDRFERAVSARHYGGFGLGLWICRRIVEAMGGTIAVESQPGAGATFTVQLPRRAAPAQTSAVLTLGTDFHPASHGLPRMAADGHRHPANEPSNP